MVETRPPSEKVRRMNKHFKPTACTCSYTQTTIHYSRGIVHPYYQEKHWITCAAGLSATGTAENSLAQSTSHNPSEEQSPSRPPRQVRLKISSLLMNFIGFQGIEIVDYHNCRIGRGKNSVKFHHKMYAKATKRLRNGYVKTTMSQNSGKYCSHMHKSRILKVTVKLILGYSGGVLKMTCLKYLLISPNQDTTPKNPYKLGHAQHCMSGNRHISIPF